LRDLDEKMKTISEIVDGVKTAVSAIPDIQDDMEQIKKTLAELLSYSKSIVLALGSSAAMKGPIVDDKISKHLLPVSTVFTAEYVGLAASSTMPKYFILKRCSLTFKRTRKVRAALWKQFYFLQRPATRR
jgi:hypothetical protein